MISSPRIKCASVSFATDVTDGGVSSDPRTSRLVVALVVSANLVALGLVLGFA